MKRSIKSTILITSIAAAVARPFAESAVAEPPAETKEEKGPPPITMDMLGRPEPLDTTSVKLRDLITDEDTQNRLALDQDTIERYAEIIKEAKKNEQPIPFPPLSIVRGPDGKLYLWDGFHRKEALKKAHESDYEADIYEAPEGVDPILYAQALAMTANATHGKPRTHKDIERVAKMALQRFPHWSNMELYRWTGISEATFRNYRNAVKSPTVRTITRKGKKTQMDTSRIGKKGGKKAKAPKKGKKGKGKKAEGATEEGGAKGPDTTLLNAFKKIGDSIEPASFAGQVRKALEDGSLDLSRGEIIAWAGYSKEKITQVAKLVVDLQMKPTRALAFLDKEIAGNTNLDTLSTLLLAKVKRKEETAGLKLEFDGEGTLTIKLARK